MIHMKTAIHMLVRLIVQIQGNTTAVIQTASQPRRTVHKNDTGRTMTMENAVIPDGATGIIIAGTGITTEVPILHTGIYTIGGEHHNDFFSPHQGSDSLLRP